MIIDLTAGQSEANGPSGSSSNGVINLTQDEDEGGIDNAVNPIELQLYGGIKTDIVGISYYNGKVTFNESVALFRQPDNQYDSNAIRVDNVMGLQVGHLPRGSAAIFARYMDCGDVLLEGIVHGTRGVYKIPLWVNVYGTPARRTAIVEELRRRGVQLEARPRTVTHQKRKRDEELTRYNLLQRERADGSWQDVLSSTSTYNASSVEQVTEKFGTSLMDLEGLPSATQPKGIKTKMLPYQLQGLGWLLQKENPPQVTDGCSFQFWKRTGDSFTHTPSNFTTRVSPDFAKGGILADDMGLGKTLEMLALIVSNVADNKDLPEVGENLLGGPTLVVCPVSLMSNWVDHIVITSYGQVAAEHKTFDAASKKRKPPLFDLKWKRVILDEAHVIRNSTTKVSKACYDLMTSGSRFTLTGTPIVNSLNDLYSLCHFIRYPVLDDKENFRRLIIRPLTDPLAGIEYGNLQNLMSFACLRRRKDMKFVDLNLPELHQYLYKMDFSEAERKVYETFSREARAMFRDVQNPKQDREERGRNRDYFHLLEILLRLRQSCNHWALCNDRIQKLLVIESAEILAATPENIEALQTYLTIAVESQEDCAVCLDTLTDGMVQQTPMVTLCKHCYHRDCILKVISVQGRCPLCRHLLKEEEVFTLPGAAQSERPATRDTSSKTDAIIKILEAAQSKNISMKQESEQLPTKTIVYSQFSKFLDILERLLEERNIPFSRIDGSMNVKNRDASLSTFGSMRECTVLLASLGVCSVGLNLTVANQVILSDSWWAPAIEAQAIDRAHRLGQTREVHVFRLIVEGTIEEKVLEIQEQKKKISRVALGEKKTKQSDKGRFSDIATLLG